MSRTRQSSTGATTREFHPDLSFPEYQQRQGDRGQASHMGAASHAARSTDRGPPDDLTRRTSRTHPRADLSRQKSRRNYFEDAFSVNPTSLARERVHGDAIVMVEVKTNVIISDEFSFITELAYHISTRYQRPVSSVVVTVQHGACLFFGGSFEPAYVMSVFALASQLLPTTNKRNAALMQKYMEETLGVGAERGLLRFAPTREEHLACGGKTMAGEIEELEARFRQEGVGSGGGSGGGEAMVSPAGGHEDRGVRSRRMMSVKSLGTLRRPPTPESTPPDSGDEGQSPVSRRAHSPQHKAAKRRKSFVATIFGRSGSKSSSDQSGLAAIVD
ncbi:Tautomerase/MIF superfamily [Staphylotrichum tortipilum]|uniref:L-dopachrome isomerase n=1 Tax=Staphylotrichum tortipilum TaxID=2831512 RepID=A0AAN6MCP0_9PEZI|nr:Tautomerase/MIF superfamily [Staphylotrichum longicolle]